MNTFLITIAVVLAVGAIGSLKNLCTKTYPRQEYVQLHIDALNLVFGICFLFWCIALLMGIVT